MTKERFSGPYPLVSDERLAQLRAFMACAQAIAVENDRQIFEHTLHAIVELQARRAAAEPPVTLSPDGSEVGRWVQRQPDLE